MPGDAATGGFIPPIYPYARLDALKQRAAEAPGGIVDLSIGTPNDPVPDIVVAALAAAGPGSAGYPRAVGGPALREAAAGWMERSFGVVVDPVQVVNCIGTKEVVASLPHLLRLRDPSRDTVLYPAVSYPTYAMGALLGGCRAVPVPLGDGWHLDLSAVSDDDAARALLLWVNEPGNPTGSQSNSRPLGEAVVWARARGVIVASDECYVEFNWDDVGDPAAGATALADGTDGVLAVHSLSKRSNMAGYRCGFLAGDGDLVAYIGSVRTHAGMMVPGPIQAAAPDATEGISYGIPMFKHHGMLVGYAAFKEHCSLFMSTALTQAHKKALAPYQTSKGTIRFTIEKPLPAALVRKLVKARIAQNEARR